MGVQKVLIYLAAIIAVCIAADEDRHITCNTDDDCTKYSLLCLNGECRCEKGKKITSWASSPDQTNRATCALVLGSDCEEDNNCKDLEWSVCRDKKCVCNEEYIPVIDSTECVRASGPDQPCTDDVQCTVTMSNYAECKQNVCKCKSGHYIGPDNKCVQAKNLGEQCTRDDECLADANVHLHCKNGECSGANYNAAVSVISILLMVCAIFLQ